MNTTGPNNEVYLIRRIYRENRNLKLLHRDNTRPSLVCDEFIRESDPYTPQS